MNDSVRRYSVEQNFSEIIEEGSEWYRASDYDQLATRLAASEAEVAGLKVARDNLTNALYAKQAKIDALMLEFCPGEMPAAQRAEWAKNQRRVTQEEHDGIQRAYWSSVTVVDPPTAIEAERDSLRDKLAKLEALVNQHCTTCIGCKGIGFVGGYISIEDGIAVDEREPCPSCESFRAALQSSEKGL